MVSVIAVLEGPVTILPMQTLLVYQSPKTLEVIIEMEGRYVVPRVPTVISTLKTQN